MLYYSSDIKVGEIDVHIFRLTVLSSDGIKVQSTASFDASALTNFFAPTENIGRLVSAGRQNEAPGNAMCRYLGNNSN